MNGITWGTLPTVDTFFPPHLPSPLLSPSPKIICTKKQNTYPSMFSFALIQSHNLTECISSTHTQMIKGILGEWGVTVLHKWCYTLFASWFSYSITCRNFQVLSIAAIKVHSFHGSAIFHGMDIFAKYSATSPEKGICLLLVLCHLNNATGSISVPIGTNRMDFQ